MSNFGTPLLVVLIGIPAAGKSTLASNLKQYAGDGQTEVLVVALDDIYVEVQMKTHGTNEGFNKQNWQVARQIWHGRLLQHLKENLRRIVVADDTTHLRSLRRKCYKLARKAGALYAQVYVPCTLELALQRNKERAKERQLPPCCVQKLFSNMESPIQSTCLWDKVTIICASGTDIQKVWSELLHIWCPEGQDIQGLPPDPKQACTAELKGQSAKHLVDLSCRHAVSQAVKSTEGVRQSALARELNAERRKYLERWRDSDEQNSETVFQQIVHNIWLAHRQ